MLRRRNCIIMVSVCKATERIRGFAVYELDTEAEGYRIMTVLNFCAIDPVARHTLIGTMGQKSLDHRRTLTWATPTY